MTKLGRPSKLSESRQERLRVLISKGLPYYEACSRAKISYHTFRNWILTGEADQEKEDELLQNPDLTDAQIEDIIENRSAQHQFLLVIRDAEAEAMENWLDQIETAGQNGQWQAAAWRLERRYPSKFGRQIHEISGPDGGAIPIQTGIKIVEVVKSYERSSDE